MQWQAPPSSTQALILMLIGIGVFALVAIPGCLVLYSVELKECKEGIRKRLYRVD